MPVSSKLAEPLLSHRDGPAVQPSYGERFSVKIELKLRTSKGKYESLQRLRMSTFWEALLMAYSRGFLFL